jgi:hypothetical protein
MPTTALSRPFLDHHCTFPTFSEPLYSPDFYYFNNQPIWAIMTHQRRKQAPAASLSLLPQKSSKNVDDQFASGKGFPTSFEIVVEMLSNIKNKDIYHYIYQVL